MRTLRRLVAIAGIPRRLAALSVLLGALAVAFGVALMATAGYLISRAAEQPPILSLTVTIVAVRFFGLARPLARYLDRLVGHDLALRALGRIRAGFYARLEPLAPAQLESYRRGDLLERMVGDVDSLQGLYLRGLGPPLAALAAGAAAVGVTAAFLPQAAVVLALGLVVAGVAVPVLSGSLARAAARRRRSAAGALTAELVELLRGAPELVAYGREDDVERRVRALDRELSRLARRDAFTAGLGEALSLAACGLTVVGVLAVSVTAHDAGTLDRVLVATLALLALASFDAVLPLPAAARELTASVASGRRLLELTDAEPKVRDPESPLAAPHGSRRGRSRGRDRPLPRRRGPCAPRRRPAARSGPQDRACRAERRGEVHRDAPPIPLPRPRARASDHRGPRRPRPSAGGRATDVRPRRAGRAPVLVDDPPEPPPRATDCGRRRAVDRPSPGAGRRLGRRAARRPQHVRRRGGRRALGRAAPASRPRPGVAGRRTCARARRADRPSRRRHGPLADGRRPGREPREDRPPITHRPEGLDRMDEVVAIDGGTRVGRRPGDGSSRRDDVSRLATT